MKQPVRPSYTMRSMPTNWSMQLLDELDVAAPVEKVFSVVAAVEEWPAHLRHYRYVRFRERTVDGGGLVEMSANRPFGVVNWPTWWLSEMRVNSSIPNVRFRHVGGITTGMEVEWSFEPTDRGTHVRLLHVWEGPRWPMIRTTAARLIIGPYFISAIAQRTMAGLARIAERHAFTRADHMLNDGSRT